MDFFICLSLCKALSLTKDGIVLNFLSKLYVFGSVAIFFKKKLYKDGLKNIYHCVYVCGPIQYPLLKFGNVSFFWCPQLKIVFLVHKKKKKQESFTVTDSLVVDIERP